MKNMKQTMTVTLFTLILMLPALAGVYAQDKITIENGEITIESEDGENLIMLDTAGLENLLSETFDEALIGMQDVMAELDDMQLEIRLGEDNQLSFETEDQMWEMNLDVIFKELGTVLETAFEGVDTDGWSDHQHFKSDDLDDDHLRKELDLLKTELNRLRGELSELKEI